MLGIPIKERPNSSEPTPGVFRRAVPSLQRDDDFGSWARYKNWKPYLSPWRLTPGTYKSPICKGTWSEPNLHEDMFHVNRQGCISPATCGHMGKNLRLASIFYPFLRELGKMAELRLSRCQGWLPQKTAEVYTVYRNASGETTATPCGTTNVLCSRPWKVK